MTSVSKIKADVIVFDQGNTLIMDPFPAVMKLQKNCFSEICQKYGVESSASQICTAWTKANGEIDYAYAGHFSQEEPIVQQALRILDVQADTAAILALELLKQYRLGLKETVSADPRNKEVSDTLQYFKDRHKRLGVFSNDRIVGLGLILNVMKVKSFFEYIETSESIGVQKPDPGVFEHILNYFQTKPDRIVYVGDDPLRDIDAAKKVGLKAIQYKVNANEYNLPWRDYSLKPEYKPDAIVNNFSELIEVID